jgi:hypothetical protein
MRYQSMSEVFGVVLNAIPSRVMLFNVVLHTVPVNVACGLLLYLPYVIAWYRM